MMIAILFSGLGAMIGSGIRFLLLEFANHYFHHGKSWMVMGINLTAAFIMGIFTGLNLHSALGTFCMTGILGGYSTFSAPMVELLDALSKPSERWRVLIKILIEFIFGVLLVMLGISLMY